MGEKYLFGFKGVGNGHFLAGQVGERLSHRER